MQNLSGLNIEEIWLRTNPPHVYKDEKCVGPQRKKMLTQKSEKMWLREKDGSLRISSSSVPIHCWFSTGPSPQMLRCSDKNCNQFQLFCTLDSGGNQQTN